MVSACVQTMATIMEGNVMHQASGLGFSLSIAAKMLILLHRLANSSGNSTEPKTTDKIQTGDQRAPYYNADALQTITIKPMNPNGIFAIQEPSVTNSPIWASNK